MSEAEIDGTQAGLLPPSGVTLAAEVLGDVHCYAVHPERWENGAVAVVCPACKSWADFYITPILAAADSTCAACSFRPHVHEIVVRRGIFPAHDFTLDVVLRPGESEKD